MWPRTTVMETKTVIIEIKLWSFNMICDDKLARTTLKKPFVKSPRKVSNPANRSPLLKTLVAPGFLDP